MSLDNPKETLVSKELVAKAPLDRKTISVTLAERDALTTIKRYHMMKVSVQEDSTEYVLKDAGDLTNTGWSKAAGSLGGYLGNFDVLNPPIAPPKDNDNTFIVNDYYVVTVGGHWNFTTGDTSPDSGTDHVETLEFGQTISYPTSGVWKVIPNADLVQSVNSKIGVVIIKALDVDIDPIAGIVGTQIQEALEELKTITDGLSTGSAYLGAFDPATPPANPPINGDDVNYSKGDFYRVTVGGIWNFPLGNQTVDGNEVTLQLNDTIRYNLSSTWDVFTDNVNLPAGTVTGAVQFRNAAGDAFDADDRLTYRGINGLNYEMEDDSSGYIILNGGVFRANLTQVNDSGALILYDNLNGFSVWLSGENGVNTNYIKPAIVFGGATLNANAQVEITSTTKGFLLPRMTTAQRTILGGLLGVGDAGMKVYDTDLLQEQSWNGTEWKSIGGGTELIVQTINHSVEGALTIDFADGIYALVNLTANVTSIVFTTPVDGEYKIEFVQDVVGGRTISFTGFHSIDGALPDYSVNASSSSLIELTLANSKKIILSMGNLIAIA